MYDYIRLYKHTLEQINFNNLNEQRCETNKITGEEIFKGKLGNLNVKQHIWGFSIDGSIAKYFLSNNIHTLTINDTKLAFEKISDELKVTIGDSKITRIDIADNFVMSNPANHYINLLFELNRFKKVKYDGSVYFNTADKKVIFYDKIKEMKNKRILIPEDFNNSQNNILRYELRFKRRLKKEFGKDIFQTDLLNGDFFALLLNKWKGYYFKTKKTPLIKIDNMTFSTTKQFLEYLITLTCIEKGQEEIFDILNRNKSHFKNKGEVTRCRQSIRKLMNNRKISQDDELIKELDEKVLETFSKYR